jgi:gas vesicle protein
MRKDNKGVNKVAENERSSAGSIFLAFLAGGLVGFGLGLLLAPLSGRETRERILDASHEVKDKAVGTVGEAREKVEGLVEQSKEKITDVKEGVVSAVQTGREAFHRTKSELIAGIKSDSSEES